MEGKERSISIYGPSSERFPLPFYRIINFPIPAEIPQVNPGIIAESCGGKIISGAFIGAILGVGMGLFMGAMGGENTAIQIWKGREVPPPPLREQIRSGWKATGAKMTGWAKNFAVLTALFGGVECMVEKSRAKHDVWNPVISGCVVGATLSASAGPTVLLPLSLSLSFYLSLSVFHSLSVCLTLSLFLIGILCWVCWLRWFLLFS
jgi:mitochondrial import inner membrane translocase subunit TIM22